MMSILKFLNVGSHGRQHPPAEGAFEDQYLAPLIQGRPFRRSRIDQLDNALQVIAAQRINHILTRRNFGDADEREYLAARFQPVFGLVCAGRG
jgi:hypothetical protein